MPRPCTACSSAAAIPAGTSTELVRNGSAGEHLGRRRRRRQVRRPGVRRGERVGAERRHLGDAELLGEVGDGVGEAVPGHVRLGPAEQQDVAAVGVVAEAQLGHRPHEAAADAVAQLEHRPAGAVVDVRVVVERDERGRRALLLERAPSPPPPRRWRRSSRSASRRAPARPAPAARRRSGGRSSWRPPAVRASERQRPSGDHRPAWPGNAVISHRRRSRCSAAWTAAPSTWTLERLELGEVAVAERAAEVAGVHALEDAGQLPVAEGDVEVELGEVAARHLGVALGQLRRGSRTRGASSTRRPRRSAGRRARSSTPAAARRRRADRRACRSPSRARRRRRRRRRRSCCRAGSRRGRSSPGPARAPARRARRGPRRRAAARGSSAGSTGRTSASAGGRCSPRGGRGRPARRRRGRRRGWRPSCRRSSGWRWPAPPASSAASAIGAVAHDVPVDEAHHVERRAVDGVVVAQAERRRHGHGRALQPGDDAVLAAHVVGAGEHVAERRAAQHERRAVGRLRRGTSGWSGRRR